MLDWIKQIDVVGLHGRFDVALAFHSDINIIYGRNGAGKTTLLHILSNVLNGDVDRLSFLAFREIRLTTLWQKRITIRSVSDRGNEGCREISVYLDQKKLTSFDGNDIRSGERSDDHEAANRVREVVRTGMDSYLGSRLVTYFPAFRSMIEAWQTRSGYVSRASSAPRYADIVNRYRHIRSERGDGRRSELTDLARQAFGQFVPELTFPSVRDIARRLAAEAERAQLADALEGEHISSKAFADAFAALLGTEQSSGQSPDEILDDIRSLLTELDALEPSVHSIDRQQDVYSRLRDILGSKHKNRIEPPGTAAQILSVYRESLRKRIEARKSWFVGIKNYLDFVNRFLEGKHLEIVSDNRLTEVVVRFDDGSRASIQALSSGERQIVSMIYALTHSTTLQGNEPQMRIALIDEPELSLHVDWQRLLIAQMVKNLPDQQIIVTTHSPEIGSQYLDRYQEIRLTSTAEPADDQDYLESEEVPDES